MKQQHAMRFYGESYAIQRPCCPPVTRIQRCPLLLLWVATKSCTLQQFIECRVRSTVIKHTAGHVAFWPQPVGSLPLAQNAWHCTSIYVYIYIRSSALRMRALRANVKPAHWKFKGRTFSANFRNSANACFLATTDHPLHFDGVNAC